jgi:hypothetical protein
MPGLEASYGEMRQQGGCDTTQHASMLPADVHGICYIRQFTQRVSLLFW